jgi:hypothetical protein
MLARQMLLPHEPLHQPLFLWWVLSRRVSRTISPELALNPDLYLLGS